MTLITPARLGLMSALCVAFAAFIAMSGDAHAAQPAASPCADTAALQRRLDDFDDRWNASDAWGLTAQFSVTGSLGAREPGRLGVYQELIERLGRAPAARRTHLVRALDLGPACLVDVQVRSGARTEPALFLLATAREGGILAMR